MSQTNMAIFVGVQDIRAAIPARYLAVSGIIAVAATGADVDLGGYFCDRCSRRWDQHGWLVYVTAGLGDSPVLDCSEAPRAGSE